MLGPRLPGVGMGKRRDWASSKRAAYLGRTAEVVPLVTITADRSPRPRGVHCTRSHRSRCSEYSAASARLDHMSDVGAPSARRSRGRPPTHLLSTIAVCGVCGAGLRAGTQNAGTRGTGSAKEARPRYRVYHCAGPSATASGRVHVSMSQEHLDQIVTEAVLARISQVDFETPRTLRDEDPNGTERERLELDIKADEIWLDAVRREAEMKRRPSILAGQERIIRPRIESARKSLDELAQIDPIVRDLTISDPVQAHSDDMTLAERRHVIQTLVIPHINPTSVEERGQRGFNERRVELSWR